MSTVIKGLNETLASIDLFGIKAIQNIERQIELSAKNIEADAKQGAPIDTGRLRAKIKATINKKELSAKVTYMGKKRAYYGKFIEFGTKNRAAKPFLGPAWDREKDSFINGVTAATNKAND